MKWKQFFWKVALHLWMWCILNTGHCDWKLKDTRAPAWGLIAWGVRWKYECLQPFVQMFCSRSLRMESWHVFIRCDHQDVWWCMAAKSTMTGIVKARIDEAQVSPPPPTWTGQVREEQTRDCVRRIQTVRISNWVFRKTFGLDFIFSGRNRLGLKFTKVRYRVFRGKTTRSELGDFA